MTHLWIDPTFGASGDMLLGALAGLHGTSDPLLGLQQLGIGGYELAQSNELRAGLTCTRVEVNAESGPARSWSSIDELLARTDLPKRAIEGARRTFRLLGEVEAAQHGVSIDEVHFHEVGAVDALVDIVGSWLLLAAIDPRSVTVGPVGLGHGTVQAAHGTLPLPAPATVALLRGCPVRGLDVEAETCTPTGAALMVTMADGWGSLPTGSIAATSRGAGKWNPTSHPNALTIIALDPTDSPIDDAIERSETALIIEANVDDISPELLARTVAKLLSSGADDAWIVPIVMKKGRPAHEVRLLCRPDRADELRAVLLAETGSLGCRTLAVTKHVSERSFMSIELHGQTIQIKIGPHGSKPEFDDLVALSDQTGIPVRVLANEVMTHVSRGLT